MNIKKFSTWAKRDPPIKGNQDNDLAETPPRKKNNKGSYLEKIQTEKITFPCNYEKMQNKNRYLNQRREYHYQAILKIFKHTLNIKGH